ncbi:hypothetical protein AKJ16_DCAP09703 [Drosera capensis]
MAVVVQVKTMGSMVIPTQMSPIVSSPRLLMLIFVVLPAFGFGDVVVVVVAAMSGSVAIEFLALIKSNVSTYF